MRLTPKLALLIKIKVEGRLKMRETFRFLLAAVMVVGAAVATDARTRTQTINLPADTSNVVFDDDDETPDVTARVARISFISGDARIRRIDSKDWETAKVNLPLVEGDEIATDANSRVEIQISSKLHIRLDHDAYFKFTTLAETGIAISLSRGTISVRARDFDKAKGYLEIDAPKTTIAIQKSGTYRVDAGLADGDAINVSATEGEARVYSDDAGFTLKGGRSARIYIDGQRAGEWDSTQALAVLDGFDQWVIDRDSSVYKRFSSAYYGKYYDDDIYGADDLNGNGDWIYTTDYGYVWRPYSSAIGGYSNWSPYRYGQWSWVSPYGWVWVNDEPWGWATYHYGRWVWAGGSWVWSPYGYHRGTRSWWFPALVVINVVANNIYWYPLDYHRDYCDFNWGYHHRNRDRGKDKDHNGRNGGWAGGPKPNPNPNPGAKPPPRRDPRDGIPPGAVVGVDAAEFNSRARFRSADQLVAKQIVEREPLSGTEIKMPEGRREVVAPPRETNNGRTRTGTGERREGASLDQELRNTRVFGGRQPAPRPDKTESPVNLADQPVEKKLGAIDRPVTKPPITEPAENRPTSRERKPPIIVSPPTGTGGTDTGAKPRPVETIESKPPSREYPRPKPVERDPSPPAEPPTREQPRNDPPPRRDPPPPKETPKSEPKVDSPVPRKKDGN